jgi:quercetin dioxygenase-like cupin family protein
MTDNPLFIERLEDLIKAFPPDSILSRTIYQDDTIKTILFGFQPGQELSQHTASVPAILQFVKGEAKVILGEENQTAQVGTWIRIPANLPHSIHAETETLMLLTLIF